MTVDKVEKNKKYIMTTKYPYELDAILDDVVVSGVIYDYRVASTFSDVISEHTRIKQMNPSIPPVEELEFLILTKEDDSRLVVATIYIEDIVEK
jgi:hypothetical protein